MGDTVGNEFLLLLSDFLLAGLHIEASFREIDLQLAHGFFLFPSGKGEFTLAASERVDMRELVPKGDADARADGRAHVVVPLLAEGCGSDACAIAAVVARTDACTQGK